MKNILCFGDSNTWGYNCETGGRYPENIRWTGLLKNLLGEDYNIIEEGLCGRTTVFEDRIEPYRSGINYLIPCLESHNPVDIVIIMLGTNDTKKRYNVSDMEITYGLEEILKEIEFSYRKADIIPKVLLLSPVPLNIKLEKVIEFDSSSIKKSINLAANYEQLAKDYDINFLKTEDYIKCLDEDGIHLNKDGHKILAEVLKEKILIL